MNLLAELGAHIFDTISKTEEYPLIRQTAEHYRKGDGTPLEINEDKLKNIDLIKDATTKNQDRLLNAILSSSQSSLHCVAVFQFGSWGKN